jgi:hypothetical protein
MMEEIIGARGFCKKCKYGEIVAEHIVCDAPNSAFYKSNTNAILCAPCFVPSLDKKDVEVQAVGFSS